MPQRREIWSFFSGGMGLDLGLEAEGLQPTLAVEWDHWCCETIRTNRPGLSLIEGDVTKISADELRSSRNFKGDVFAMVGGPPCQSFSPGGNRAGVSDPRGNLIYEYLRLIAQVRPRFFVMENVANLITAAMRHRPIEKRPGKNWNLSAYSCSDVPETDGNAPLAPDELAGSAIRQILKDVQRLGYAFSFRVVDAAMYGAPQHRLRFVLLGSREGPAPQLPRATHGDPGERLLPFRTIRDAIYDLRENAGPHSTYTPKVARVFDLVPPGGYWKDLPLALQKTALGKSFHSGGGKTGFFRRLNYDLPSPTVTTKPNRKGTSMCHPEFVRPLSVSECARLQGFPDDWRFSGAMNQQYQQIGNAVPTHLGRAVAQAISNAWHIKNAALRMPTKFEIEAMLSDANAFLRSKARNKRGKNKRGELAELFNVA